TTIPYLLTWYRSVGKDNLNEAPIILSNNKSLHLNDANFNTQGIYWVHFESTTGGDNSGVNYEWALLRGGNIIRHYSEDSTLEIKKADPWNDYGVYRCEVEDDDGELIGQAYTAVTIGFTDPSNARVVKFDEKSSATIECPVYAIPGATVTWEKEDGELPVGAKMTGNKLIIDEFDDDAVGMYVCKVDIHGKQIEGYVKAEIYVPDTIIQVLLEPSSETISLGDRAWFDCKVTGDPDAEITWTKEGEDELPDNTQVMGNRLLFVNVREDNGGIYKCHAKTKAGPLETRNVLNVGIAKRKRKRISRKKEKRAHKQAGNNDKKMKHSSSIFGTWFTSS
uniref:Ig-like domain-containing protein n=2 Tax=Wuchereria bancrofti TaxID=6293 RepID=A0A1I8ETJ6_WUCBA